MGLLSDLRMFGRFAAGLGPFYRRRLTLPDAQRVVTERLARREDNFFRLAERAVYGYPASPYRALLLGAGCELGDLKALVRLKGLEPALCDLRAAGVFVTFEEFKGRTPLVRKGQTLANDAHAFDNPFLAPAYETETGGSTGLASRIAQDLDHQADLLPHHLLMWAAHGVSNAPFVVWRGILPDASGINNVLRAACGRHWPMRWFSHTGLRDSREWLRNAAATYTFVLASRARGVKVPFPEYVRVDEAATVAAAVRAVLDAHGQCFVSLQVSRAMRLCLAAQSAGYDLTGAVFMIAGEPPSPAKLRVITQTGVRAFSTYGMAEIGRVAMGCANPADGTDVHVLQDAFALVTHLESVNGFDLSVPAFNITTLLPTSPKIMLNVVCDDYGIVEERACGCPFESYGFRQHLRSIRSYRKLTAEGVTLVGNDLIRVLEDVLPARFGGTPLDYQLMEHEDELGLTRLSLIVNPTVKIEDEQSVVRVMLQALRDQSPSADSASAVWASAGTLRIIRRAPIWTSRGKFNPLVQTHLHEIPSDPKRSS